MIKQHLHSFGIILILATCTLVAAALIVLFIAHPKTGEAPLPNGPSAQSIVSPSGKLVIDNLAQNQSLTLPMTVTGTVQNWFFEGSFPVFVKDANGNQLGVALASSPVDWMTANPIPFTVTLPSVNYTGSGSLVFTKDNPSGEPQFDDSFTVQVVFQ